MAETTKKNATATPPATKKPAPETKNKNTGDTPPDTSGQESPEADKAVVARLRKSADELFDAHPELQFVWGTPDGNLFFPEAEQFAKSHAVHSGHKEPLKVAR